MKQMHIFCEGETEKHYLKGYITQTYPGLITSKTVIIHSTSKNTAASLVDEAIAYKEQDTIRKGDSFWVVCDRESPTDYSDQLHQKALDKSNSNLINLALSNVCIEVWLLLHFSESSAPYENCTDLLNRSNLKDYLRDVGVQEYRKSDELLFSKILSANSNAIQEARARATRINNRSRQCADHDRNQPYQLNPYTDMHLVLDAIDEFNS